MRVTPDYVFILTFPNLVFFMLFCQTELGVLDHTRACLAPKIVAFWLTLNPVPAILVLYFLVLVQPVWSSQQ